MDQVDALKLVIVCVGLPARGKSYITKKLQRYLNWSQYNTRIFNVGNTRRQLKVFKPSTHPISGPTLEGSNRTLQTSHDANFFDNSNQDNFQLREQWAKETLQTLLDFLLTDDGNVGIFDATNTTKARRRWIVETINKRTKGLVKILFLESICTDANLIEKNIHLKLQGPDYKKMDSNLALADFRNRLCNYEAVYETIDVEEEKLNERYDIQYVKIINAGKKVISYNISGYLSSQCVFFLLNFNLTDRQIWLTANGESVDNVSGIKGGDSDLTKKGFQFAKALPKFIAKKRQEFKIRQLNKEYIQDCSTFVTEKQDLDSSNDDSVGHKHFSQQFNVWTSTLKRTIESAQYFPADEYILKSFRTLNNIGCGSFNQITDEEFKTLHPIEYMESIENKLSFRYPGLSGESYLDVISRLRPIIIELERLKDHVLIVSHRVIIRVLLCYFMNLNKEMLTELDIQHGYVYCIEPKPYGLDLNVWQYDNTTDMFCEVDVAEILKKKKRSASGVLNDVEKLRQMLMEAEKNAMHHLSSSYEDIESLVTATSSEPSDDESDGGVVLDAKHLSGRSDSQAFEFSRSSAANLRSLLSQSDLKKKLSSSNLVSGLVNGSRGFSSTELRRLASVTSMSSSSASAYTGSRSLSISRSNSLKHIKKPSIDWDIYDPGYVQQQSTDNHNGLEMVASRARSLEAVAGKLSMLNSNREAVSEYEVKLENQVNEIMSNPNLLERLKLRLQELQ